MNSNVFNSGFNYEFFSKSFHYEIYEKDSEIIVLVTIPGFDICDIDLILNAFSLEIELKNIFDENPDKNTNEILNKNGKIKKRIDFPYLINVKTATATFESGLLKFKAYIL